MADRRGGGWPVFLLKVAVAAAILYVLFRQVPAGQVVNAMLAASPLPLLGALCLALAAQIAAAYRLRVLAAAHGLEFSTREMLGINLSALFYGLFVPGGNVTAGAVRLYKMTRTDGRLAEALSSILRDRLDATLALAVVGLLFLAWDRSLDAPLARLGLAAGLVGCLLLWALLFRPRAARWVRGRFERLPVRLVRRPLVRLWEELEVAGRIPSAVQARVFCISLFVQLLGVGTYLMLVRSLALDVSLTAIGWIRSAVIFVTMIPVSLGGIGLREGAFLFFLSPYALPEDRILALSFLVFAATVVLFGAAGGLVEARGLVTGRRAERSDRGGSGAM